MDISWVVDISDGIVENVRLEPMVLVQPSQCYVQIWIFEHFMDFQLFDFDSLFLLLASQCWTGDIWGMQ